MSEKIEKANLDENKKMEKKVSRRSFLKGAGAAALGTAAAASLGKGGAEAAGISDLAVRSTDKPYELDEARFSRFSETKTCFSRMGMSDPVFKDYGANRQAATQFYMENNPDGYGHSIGSSLR